MKSGECSEDGYDQQELDNTKGIHMDTFCDVERLRKETRGRPVVVVRVVSPLRVELDLAIVELEVRGVREVAIGIRSIALVYP